MPLWLRLTVLPVTGLALLLAALLWSKQELKLRFFGQPAQGLVVGMALVRADEADLLAQLETELVLTLANGELLLTRHVNHRPSFLGYQKQAGGPTEPLALTALEETVSPLSEPLRRATQECVTGDATLVRWTLQREARRVDDPTRVVRVEKTETVRGWFNLPAVPDVLPFSDGRIDLGDVHAPHAGVVRIHAVFDHSDPRAVQEARGESLVEFSYERNAGAVTGKKRNFFLAAEPYETEFRPVFAYESDGVGVARLSHIGRQGGPTLALRLFQPCRVYYDAQHPEQAIVTALPGPVEGSPLDWFSRLCEGIFAQWGATTLIALAGSMFIVTGLGFLSLVLFPSRKLVSRPARPPVS